MLIKYIRICNRNLEISQVMVFIHQFKWKEQGIEEKKKRIVKQRLMEVH